MIAPAVQAEVRKFKNFWEPYLGVSPFLALDESWFSIGVIDALTFALRKKTELTAFERTLIRGASAYLASMAARCWSSFGAVTVVEFRETGIVLRAIEGPGIENGEEVIAHVERDFGAMLESLPRPLPIFATFSRIVSDVENFVAPFAFGLFSGLLPSLEGPWEKETPASFAENLDKLQRYLAVGCATTYARLFPKERFGQVPELYLRGLIYPLTLMDEDLPVRSSCKALLEFAKEFQLDRAALLALAYNLSQLPDERISQTGFVVYSAACPGALSPEILARGYYWGTAGGVLRQALKDVRAEYLGIGEDWLDKATYSEAEQEEIKKELRLYYLPWVKLPMARVLSSSADTRLRQALRALSEFDMNQSILLLDQLIEANPDDFEIRLQRIHLELLSANFEQAEEDLKTLYTEPGSENVGQLFNLLGMFQLGQGNLQQTEKYLKHAQALTLTHPLLYSEVCNNLGWFYLISDKLKEAHRAFDESLRVVPDAVNVLLNKSTALHQENREDEAALIDKRLLELSPFERAVFRGLVFDPALPESNSLD